MAAEEKVIMDNEAIGRALRRIAHEIVEKNRGVEDLCLVGIRSGGENIAQRIAGVIEDVEGKSVPCGYMDINLYRDDIQHKKTLPVVQKTQVDFPISDKVVVVVDDVIFTGRTLRAAMDGIMDLGRPRRILFAALVDRGHRELPVRADFVGRNIPTARSDLVLSHIGVEPGSDKVVNHVNAANES